MRLKNLGVVVLLASATGVSAAANYIVPTTTLAAQTVNNTSAANTFVTQTNGNVGASNISKVDVHSLLYSGASTKVYAHLLLWFGQSNHMNVGYSSTDPVQIHRQITDMISRGIDGVIIDWYGPNNSIDQATQLVMAEAEAHPGFTFAIMVDQGAIRWDSCAGCTPQQALISQLQYIEQTYFPSSAYMRQQGRPVITNFNIDLAYTIDWSAVSEALATQPVFLFQNDSGFTHVRSGGSYSWVMPTTSDYGMSYLTNFYDTGMPLATEATVGASYKGFNDSLAAWGSGRIMGQQCGQTWLETFSEINSLYNSGRQLPALQLVTWNDYEEGSEIESGISNCLTLSATIAGNALTWRVNGNGSAVDHYVAYISTDGQNLMTLAEADASMNSLNLCSYSIPSGNYVLYVQAVGKPTITNQISAPVKFAAACAGSPSVSFGANPSAVTVAPGNSGRITVTAVPQSGAFNNAIALSCSGLPNTLTCLFAPASITPGNNTVSSVLTISAASVASIDRRPRRGNPLLATWFLSLGVAGIALVNVKRERILSVLEACALAMMIAGSISCGGSNINASPAKVLAGNTAPSSYSVRINGNSGPAQLSATITVTVQ